MKITEFLLDKKLYFIGHGLSLCFLMLFLSVMDMNTASIIFVLLFMLMGHFMYLLHEYFRRFRFYKTLNSHLELLDKKHLISEFVETPNFYEGIFLEKTLQVATKSMNDEISKHKTQLNDYRDYIETWVHEVKTPIAATHLIIDNEGTLAQVKTEINRVEDYVEQALYYAKSHHLEQDYIIKPVLLKDLISQTLRKHSRLLIGKKCEILIDVDDTMVFTDIKWTRFVLGQIVANSIQYSKSPMSLNFQCKKVGEAIVLSIEDSGIGIPEEDIRYVFEKGFVGNTGRKTQQSTGIGLYLSKRLCEKMGLSIHIESKVNKGTTVHISFPVSEHPNRS